MYNIKNNDTMLYIMVKNYLLSIFGSDTVFQDIRNTLDSMCSLYVFDTIIYNMHHYGTVKTQCASDMRQVIDMLLLYA